MSGICGSRGHSLLAGCSELEGPEEPNAAGRRSLSQQPGQSLKRLEKGMRHWEAGGVKEGVRRCFQTEHWTWPWWEASVPAAPASRHPVPAGLRWASAATFAGASQVVAKDLSSGMSSLCQPYCSRTSDPLVPVHGSPQESLQILIIPSGARS